MLMRILFAIVLVLGAVATATATTGWKRLETTPEGYEVSIRQDSGSALPSMRGRGVLQADIIHLLAVILDSKHSGEWSGGGDEVEILRRRGPLAEVLYTQTDLRWPLTNRDMVVRGKLEVRKSGEEFWVGTTCIPDYLPEKDGVIRIRDCSAHFHLKALPNGRTWVEYVVNVDPGGSLPNWVVRMASKSIPGGTLADLQAQVNRTQGKYERTKEGLRRL